MNLTAGCRLPDVAQGNSPVERQVDADLVTARQLAHYSRWKRQPKWPGLGLYLNPSVAVVDLGHRTGHAMLADPRRRAVCQLLSQRPPGEGVLHRDRIVLLDGLDGRRRKMQLQVAGRRRERQQAVGVVDLRYLAGDFLLRTVQRLRRRRPPGLRALRFSTSRRRWRGHVRQRGEHADPE